MSENVRQALDIGNKVRIGIYNSHFPFPHIFGVHPVHYRIIILIVIEFMCTSMEITTESVGRCSHPFSRSSVF